MGSPTATSEEVSEKVDHILTLNQNTRSFISDVTRIHRYTIIGWIEGKVKIGPEHLKKLNKLERESIVRYENEEKAYKEIDSQGIRQYQLVNLNEAMTSAIGFKILKTLVRGPMTVSQIASTIGKSKQSASCKIKELTELQLIMKRRGGNRVYCRLTPGVYGYIKSSYR